MCSARCTRSTCPTFPAFDSLARRLIVRQPNWSALLLADLNGRVIGVAPEGGRRRRRLVRDRLGAGRRLRRKKSVVSKLFEMPGMPGHFVMIGVPIVRDGKVTLALGARVRSDSLGAILRQQQVPPNGAVSLVDAGYRTVARTKQEERYVGTHGQPGVHRSDLRGCRKAAG